MTLTSLKTRIDQNWNETRTDMTLQVWQETLPRVHIARDLRLLETPGCLPWEPCGRRRASSGWRRRPCSWPPAAAVAAATAARGRWGKKIILCIFFTSTSQHCLDEQKVHGGWESKRLGTSHFSVKMKTSHFCHFPILIKVLLAAKGIARKVYRVLKKRFFHYSFEMNSNFEEIYFFWRTLCCQ